MCSLECQKNPDCYGFQYNGEVCQLGAFQVMDNANGNEIWFLEAWEPVKKSWFMEEEGSLNIDLNILLVNHL